jgi:hypothetical protein
MDIQHGLGGVDVIVDSNPLTVARLDELTAAGFEYLPTLLLHDGFRFPVLGQFPRVQLYWEEEVGGLGVKTLDRIPAGELVGEFGGKEVVQGDDSVDDAWAFNTVHASGCGNEFRFLNHWCKNWNLRARPMEGEDPRRVFLFSVREITPGSILRINYGAHFHLGACSCPARKHAGGRKPAPRGPASSRDSEGHLTRPKEVRKRDCVGKFVQKC